MTFGEWYNDKYDNDFPLWLRYNALNYIMENISQLDNLPDIYESEDIGCEVTKWVEDNFDNLNTEDGINEAEEYLKSLDISSDILKYCFLNPWRDFDNLTGSILEEMGVENAYNLDYGSGIFMDDGDTPQDFKKAIDTEIDENYLDEKWFDTFDVD